MRIRIHTFEWDHTELVETPDRLIAQAKEQAHERKFVLWLSPDRSEMHMLVGPEYVSTYGHQRNYRHRDLMSIARGDCAPGGKEAGGGRISFAPSENEYPYSILFHDGSGDYGIWDPAILGQEERQVIVRWFGVQVQFRWIHVERPK